MAAISCLCADSTSMRVNVPVQDECKVSSVKKDCFIEDENISYETEAQKMQIIESVAARISSLYGNFLKADWHAERVKASSFEYQGLTFNYKDKDKLPSKFPSSETIEKFIENLKKSIITELSQQETMVNVELSTNYAPVGLLDNVLDTSGIEHLGDVRMLLFPIKSSVTIQDWSSTKQIQISTSF